MGSSYKEHTASTTIQISERLMMTSHISLGGPYLATTNTCNGHAAMAAWGLRLSSSDWYGVSFPMESLHKQRKPWRHVAASDIAHQRLVNKEASRESFCTMASAVAVVLVLWWMKSMVLAYTHTYTQSCCRGLRVVKDTCWDDVERSRYQSSAPAETLLLIQLPPAIGRRHGISRYVVHVSSAMLFHDVEAHGFTVTPMLMQQ